MPIENNPSTATVSLSATNASRGYQTRDHFSKCADKQACFCYGTLRDCATSIVAYTEAEFNVPYRLRTVFYYGIKLSGRTEESVLTMPEDISGFMVRDDLIFLRGGNRFYRHCLTSGTTDRLFTA